MAKAKAELRGPVEACTRNAPFIELRNAGQRKMFIDHRRIVAVRDPAYDEEQPYGSVIVLDGIPRPWTMDDTSDHILELVLAAVGRTPTQSTPAQGTFFVELSFSDETAIHIDHRRIIAVQESPEARGGTWVWIDGYSNFDSDEDVTTYSIRVEDRWDDILTMIRQAERQVAEA